MIDVLFIKTSSLGDVIHHMPALTEAAARRPDARFSWVVEEAFAPLVRLHPSVSDVIPVAARRWRRALYRPSTWQAMAAFQRSLHKKAFDEIIDTQGLLFKSALIARYAQGRRRGYDRKSIKEPFASYFYDVKHKVAWDQHAIARNRALTAEALGYVAEGPPDYGLDRKSIAGSVGSAYGVLLHGTARPDKQWPETNWRMLAASLGTGIDLVVPFGTDAERERALRIASATSRATVPGRVPLDAMARLIAGASFVVGVDTGLLHLAAALGVPLAAIFLASEPALTGPMGAGPITVLGAKGAPPSVAEVVDAVGEFSG
jgi:heptosyltransferase-1